MLVSIIRLIRPQQWVKNVFVFLPLFFGQQMWDYDLWLPAICAFFAFCFASSGIYCLNDIRDAEADRQHPTKKNRPIASGAISKSLGCRMMAVCFIVSIALVTLAGIADRNILLQSLCVVMLYILLNIAYCIVLKRFSIVDVFIISVGFVLRLFLGGIVTNIVLSHWIIMMTFFLALFIALGKRRDDVLAYETKGVKHRSNIARYNLAFMNQSLGIIASITMVCYVMYSVSEDVVNRLDTHYLYVTSVFVIAGIMRYLQLTLVDAKSGSPTKLLLHDRFIQACIVGWILLFFVILYL